MYIYTYLYIHICIHMCIYIYMCVCVCSNKSKIPKPSQILLQTQQPNCIHIYRHILKNPNNKNIKIIPQEEAYHSAKESSAVWLRYLWSATNIAIELHKIRLVDIIGMMLHAINVFAEVQAWVTEIHVLVMRMMITSTALLLFSHLRSLSRSLSWCLSLSLFSQKIFCVLLCLCLCHFL